MKRIVALMFVIVCAACAVTEPESTPWTRLVEQISRLEQYSIDSLKVAAANYYSRAYIQARLNEKIGEIKCENDTGGTGYLDVVASDLLQCITQGAFTSMNGCIGSVMNNKLIEMQETFPGRCEAHRSTFWSKEKLPRETSSEGIDLDDVARALLESPAPLPGFGAAQLIELLPGLCVLDANAPYGCPEPDQGDR